MAHYDSAWGFGRRYAPSGSKRIDNMLAYKHAVFLHSLSSRTCVGRYMAFNMAWITLAQIFAVYDIDKAKDTQGNVIEPSSEITPSIAL